MAVLTDSLQFGPAILAGQGKFKFNMPDVVQTWKKHRLRLRKDPWCEEGRIKWTWPKCKEAWSLKEDPPLLLCVLMQDVVWKASGNTEWGNIENANIKINIENRNTEEAGAFF